MKFKIRFAIITTIGLALLLMPGCSSAAGSTNASAAEAENLAKAFISAYEARDTAKTLDLFSEDAIYMDNGSPGFRGTGQMYVRNIRTEWAQTFQDPAFQLKFDSHFVSADGKFATFKGTYTNVSKGGSSSASVPIVILLEMNNGKIVREDDYYDSSPFE